MCVVIRPERKTKQKEFIRLHMEVSWRDLAHHYYRNARTNRTSIDIWRIFEAGLGAIISKNVIMQLSMYVYMCLLLKITNKFIKMKYEKWRINFSGKLSFECRFDYKIGQLRNN